MSSAPIHVVVLAAGQGTRMKSNLPKVLHRVPGGSMLNCVLRTAEALSPRRSRSLSDTERTQFAPF